MDLQLKPSLHMKITYSSVKIIAESEAITAFCSSFLWIRPFL